MDWSYSMHTRNRAALFNLGAAIPITESPPVKANTLPSTLLHILSTSVAVRCEVRKRRAITKILKIFKNTRKNTTADFLWATLSGEWAGYVGRVAMVV